MPVLDQQVLNDDREALALLDAILGARKPQPGHKPKVAVCPAGGEVTAKSPAFC